ncbi:DUF262 domain-containing protein [Paenibacillus sp. FSL H8-0283]|uniref:GmrSD restriction endonuclease domain-containing protein n=1 Tax=Paenibacillus sp. FSL H8-0283 TaxID=2921383 RepID=UPI003247C9D6
MSESKKITLLDLKTQYKMGLRIPEIQRDYVMGAGGKDGDGKDKLIKLLNVILAKCKGGEDFDFSCIITYCSDTENTPLEIYDGQQRLTTLMIIMLYKLRVEIQDVSRFEKWYSFAGRPKANEIFNLLTQKKSQINNIIVTDFTSFSMKKLLEKIALPKYKDISSDYLLNHVKFDMVSIGSQNEIEQFFMDLNSGVKLKDYELYKAKLTHRVGQLKHENVIDMYDESLEMWSHKVDNDWLNYFDIFADYEHPAEEYEIAFLKYCINMICIDNEEDPSNLKIDSITADIIKQIYDKMQMVTKLNFNFVKRSASFKGVLHYSWGLSDSDNLKSYNCNRRGAFWNLDFEEYDKVLYCIIKFVLLDRDKGKELKNDVLLWCFITTLGWKVDFQNEYLRLVKIILNHNVVENTAAWYECQNKGQYLYYCKYSVYAIPQYYGKHIDLEITDDGIKHRHLNVFLFNKFAIQNVMISNMLSREKITNSLMDQIKDTSIKHIEFIINSRIRLLQSHKYSQEYIAKENAVFGIIDKIETPIKVGYYLGKVILSWPTRGQQSPLDCYIRLKCKSDLMFLQFDDAENQIVEKTVNKMGKEFIDKCFWTHSNTVHKLIDRVTQTSTTYNKKDSESGWRETVYL